MSPDSLLKTALYQIAAKIQGRVLREARLHHNWSQPEAAEAVGVGESCYVKWEHGYRHCPDDKRRRLAELWGIDPAALGLEPAKACPCCGRKY